MLIPNLHKALFVVRNSNQINLNKNNMKFIKAFLVVLLLNPFILFAQKTIYYYFDNNWIGVSQEQNYSYYRKVEYDNFNRLINPIIDYYKNGNVQSKLYADNYFDVSCGKFPNQCGLINGSLYEYDSIGNLTTSRTFMNGKYKIEYDIKKQTEKTLSTSDESSIANRFKDRIENLPIGSVLTIINSLRIPANQREVKVGSFRNTAELYFVPEKHEVDILLEADNKFRVTSVSNERLVIVNVKSGKIAWLESNFANLTLYDLNELVKIELPKLQKY
jgi:hypothetical protein